MLDQFAGRDEDLEGTRVLQFFVPCLVDNGTDEFLDASVGGEEGGLVGKLGIQRMGFSVLDRNLRCLDEGRVRGGKFGLDGEGAAVHSDIVGRGGDDSPKIVPAR